MGVKRLSLIGRRACAVLAACSAVLHATMLGHAPNPVSGGLLAVMAAGCLFCAYELWVAGPLRAWVIVALMNLAMIALHIPGPGHHHGPGAAVPTSTLMQWATMLALIETTAAGVVLYYRTRHRLDLTPPVA
ncbi:hypothetical protein M1247_33345 [Mycobacterium sp. 21AC1]|jgi:hypothetical protein|uniref:hypothetical protein n=1 Tax=[Mycobacterium] appelbergii TaxID=2939269 RepID=UPI0029392A83|nr:hypothetical protein [Mycobacterium sp. 21AC1]MDV3129832.1 hypothetical protein [Mycobacterium sp. 21AC1]